MIDSSDNQTTVLFIRGLPGSGKTTIANILKENLPKGTKVLDPDDVNQQSRAYLDHVKNMISQKVDSKLFVYRYLRQQAYQSITDKRIVIWNQPFTSLEIFNKLITRLKDHAKSVNVKLKIYIIEVEIDDKLAYSRVIKRIKDGGHGPSKNRFMQHRGDYSSFANAGYDVITVNGYSSKKAALELLDKLSAL